MDLFSIADSHSGDPVTSFEASRKHRESGRLDRNRDLVLTLVKLNPFSTAVELWQQAGDVERSQLAEMQEVRRRLCDLEKFGLVAKGTPRKCSIRGTLMVTWTAIRICQK